ncbi:MAG TPA: radical SAM family heme chaperone HemW [Chthoniobacterales bacterium]|nr:radical SAM family heme chaperone HemW [Chthoniobacterales bacterium]
MTAQQNVEPAFAPDGLRRGEPARNATHSVTGGRPIRQRTDSPWRTTEAVRHLYVHIPFCARICPYCAFYKERADSSQTQRFCEALLRELEAVGPKLEPARPRAAGFQLQPKTIFFGGGTPTALTTAQLEFLLGGLRERLDLTRLVEWTVEANPGSVSPRKAALLRKMGVNRISLGVQSWDEELLKLLGREHNAAQAEASFQIFREAGFTNVSIDLMFGLPGQTLAQWEADLAKTIALQPDHISTYCLTYEEDTEFFLRHAKGEFREDPESDARFLESAMRMLQAAGFEHYEVSNYARPGFESAHNRGYWAGHDYLGIGPSAFSTVDLTRWQNVCDYRAYSDRVLIGSSAIASTEILTPAMKRTEKIALSLRTGNGIPSDELSQWPNESREFVDLGLLREAGGNYVLTPRGKLLADSVAEAFV